jgi:hypothetical protein
MSSLPHHFGLVAADYLIRGRVWQTKKNIQVVLSKLDVKLNISDKPCTLPPKGTPSNLLVSHRPRMGQDIMCHFIGATQLFPAWNHFHLAPRNLDLLLNHFLGEDPLGSA